MNDPTTKALLSPFMERFFSGLHGLGMGCVLVDDLFVG